MFSVLSMLRFAPATVLVVSLVAMTTARAQDDKKQGEKKIEGPVVSLQTVYLSDPVGSAHRILVVGELGGKGELTLDGNTCTISQFGDPDVCTEIHFPPLKVDIVQLRLADNSGQGRRIYQLQGKLEPEGFRYFLIIPRRRSQPHRLVVDMVNDHRRVITLEAIPAARTGIPELAKSAKYRGEQSAGKVTMFASGEHPTAGWKTTFEQLPIRIFPPQYRLVVVKPTGIVAQVVTPFEVHISFKSEQEVPQVTIHDAAGQHRVPVAQTKEKKRP